ncbi:hypothetical protein Ddye_027053 [Dipteronia dyeriana]|uniref:Uncharacterized protein n=1 Tax=Dipteronia dyeriana TaxID=168575 RepID=A0AAD9WR08_9ROSI|nr:hypothetical protein Ddye_027053 [Dipteronia dyeriana]
MKVFGVERAASLLDKWIELAVVNERYGTFVWPERIKKILELAYEFEELSISISIRHTDLVLLEKFKDFLLPVHREVGNLTIEVLALPPSNYAALLDFLLCIFCPRILSIKPYNGRSIKFIMWTRKCRKEMQNLRNQVLVQLLERLQH